MSSSGPSCWLSTVSAMTSLLASVPCLTNSDGDDGDDDGGDSGDSGGDDDDDGSGGDDDGGDELSVSLSILVFVNKSLKH